MIVCKLQKTDMVAHGGCKCSINRTQLSLSLHTHNATTVPYVYAFLGTHYETGMFFAGDHFEPFAANCFARVTPPPSAMQPFFSETFDRLLRFLQITFAEELKITEMISGEGEKVPFTESLYPKGNVEDWLLEVERVMRESLRKILSDSLENYKEVCLAIHSTESVVHFFHCS